MEGLPVSDVNMTIKSHAGPYQVFFDDLALDALNANVPEGVHFIIDAKVANLYREKMQNILAHESVLLIDALEENKALDAFPAYVKHLVECKVRKDHKLCAIGGGITQDITCFLAATMLRGVDWIFYPTTLLAQADSCIGSKSSINAGDAKNILGTFTPPREVHIDTRFLATLEEVDVRSGVGEMLKVHVIDGPDSFNRISAAYNVMFDESETMRKFIHRSLQIKQAYIERDEFDVGPRRVFNYGHSFGHAIESATHFAIPHGVAVSIGADMANFVAWKLAAGSQANFERMHPAFKKNYKGFYGFPVPLEAFYSAIGKDKKNTGKNSLTLILPDHKGTVFIGRYENDSRFRTACEEFFSGCYADE